MDSHSLEAYLISRSREDRVSLHMPGHKGAALFHATGHGSYLQAMVEGDITELPGSDDLFAARGIIGATQERYRRLYGVRKSYLQVNGSSGALIASILAVCPPGGKLIVARNCHKSVFNALQLGRIEPVYLEPEILPEGICGAVSPRVLEEALRDHPEAAGAVITSPNYYGVLSEVKTLAKIMHERGKVLITDQAHGAHLAFFDERNGTARSAERGGSDLVVNSIHKTLAGFTQSGILNLCSDRVDKALLEEKLQMIQSSSPSYMLMGGLDVNADILEKQGKELIDAWQVHLDYFYQACREIPGLKVLEAPFLDESKLNVSLPGLSGEELAERLAEEYAIDVELATGDLVMGLTGIGNIGRDYDRFLAALADIAASLPKAEEREKAPVVLGKRHAFAGLPERKEKVPLAEAAGRVCAASLVPYPPGIPLVCPGEIISPEDVAYLTELREKGVTVMGLSEEGTLFAGA